MIKHIVMWKFKEEAGGRSRQENMDQVKQRLEALTPVIGQIRHLELQKDIGADRDPSHMILITTFDDREALETYQSHPSHKAVSAFVSTVIESRAVVDYECE